MTSPEITTRICIYCASSLEGERPNRKICRTCSTGSRSPESRREQYLATRKARNCKQCSVELELGTRKSLCDPCRETPNPRCKKCKKVKPLSSFSHDTTRPSGYFPWCLECSAESTSAAKFQDPSDEPNGHICPLCDTVVRGHKNRRFDSATCKDRVRNLKSKFGLEVADYRRMIEASGGRCAICQNRVKQWHVDHNHKTGLVTGIVCAACNVGALAMTFHDVEFVRRLLSFLESTPASQLGITAIASEEANKPSQLHRMWGAKNRRA